MKRVGKMSVIYGGVHPNGKKYVEFSNHVHVLKDGQDEGEVRVQEEPLDGADNSRETMRTKERFEDKNPDAYWYWKNEQDAIKSELSDVVSNGSPEDDTETDEEEDAAYKVRMTMYENMDAARDYVETARPPSDSLASFYENSKHLASEARTMLAVVNEVASDSRDVGRRAATFANQARSAREETAKDVAAVKRARESIENGDE